jgi:hypothetical protein
MTQYVLLSNDGTQVTTVFGGSQLALNPPNYAEVPDIDPRYVAFMVKENGAISYNAALQAGVALTSASNPALNGTYKCNAIAQAQIISEAVYIQSTGGPTTGTFTNGQTSKFWLDLAGGVHSFTPQEFINFAQAIANYVDSLTAAMAEVTSGAAWTAPPMPAPMT